MLAGGAGKDTGDWARGGDAGDDIEDLARALHDLGPQDVVITGGHRDEITDVFFDGHDIHSLPGERTRTVLRMGRAVPTRARWRPTSRSAITPLEAAERARAHRLGGRARRTARHRPGGGAGGRAGRRRPRLTARQPGATAPSKATPAHVT